VDVLYRFPTVATLAESYQQHLLKKSPYGESPIATATAQGDYEEGRL
jgi:hypothetical protein